MNAFPIRWIALTSAALLPCMVLAADPAPPVSFDPEPQAATATPRAAESAPSPKAGPADLPAGPGEVDPFSGQPRPSGTTAPPAALEGF